MSVFTTSQMTSRRIYPDNPAAQTRAQPVFDESPTAMPGLLANNNENNYH
jgi:hypothetical protein